jgi:subtilisin family serine protease
VEFGSFTVGAAGARQIVIRRYAHTGPGAGTPRIKFISNDNGAQTLQTTQPVAAPDVQGPTIYGHNGADASITVGAVPFNNSNTMETFSGRGPVTSVFAPVNGATPSAAFGAPQVLSKPDVSATDRGITTFFGGGNRFSGTSAATPHAAAVGALQLAAIPSLTRDQIEAAQKATARPVGAFGPLDMGAGLIDAQAAILANPTQPPTVAITDRPAANSTDNTPVFAFGTAGRIVSTTCTVDGVGQACTSPFATAPLGDGDHTVTVVVTDPYGQTGQAAASFGIDTTGPAKPEIDKGPDKKTKKNKAKFTFSGEAGETFDCAIDDQTFKPCTSPAKFKVKKAKPKAKKHLFAVVGTDALGNEGEVAVYKWKVVKKK